MTLSQTRRELYRECNVWHGLLCVTVPNIVEDLISEVLAPAGPARVGRIWVPGDWHISNPCRTVPAQPSDDPTIWSREFAVSGIGESPIPDCAARATVVNPEARHALAPDCPRKTPYGACGHLPIAGSRGAAESRSKTQESHACVKPIIQLFACPPDRQSENGLSPESAEMIDEAHRDPAQDVSRRFDLDGCGLTGSQVIVSRSVWGFNELPDPQRPMPWRRVARQFRDLMIWVLLVAAMVSAVSGEWTDAFVILALVVLNGTIGFVQEEKAGRALAALRKLSEPEATVLRDGAVRRIPARELVPHDRITIAAGDEVPADARLIASHELAVQESVLTGESTHRSFFPSRGKCGRSNRSVHSHCQ